MKVITNRCVGKNVADAVESLICALYLSTNCLKSTLEWISDIKLVPLKMTDMLHKFNYGEDYSFRLYKPLSLYDLKTTDYASEMFEKYFAREDVDENFKALIRGKMMMDFKEVGELGEAYEYCKYYKGEQLIGKARELIKYLEVNVLNYEFKNPMLLLEALTHRSAKDQLEVGICYEKLEVLGDSILDYLCNYSLIRYTLFERYMDKDPSVY